jgi:hypothetical protein
MINVISVMAFVWVSPLVVTVIAAAPGLVSKRYRAFIKQQLVGSRTAA